MKLSDKLKGELILALKKREFPRELIDNCINEQEDISQKALLLGIIQLGAQFGGFMGGMTEDKLWLICNTMQNTPNGLLVSKFFALGCHIARCKCPEMNEYLG